MKGGDRGAKRAGGEDGLGGGRGGRYPWGMTKWITILLACAGVALGLYTIATTGADRPVAKPPAAAPSVNPYARGIAASGTVEAASRNVMVSAAESGLVLDVLAQVGDRVKKGQVLAHLDARLLEAEKLRLEAGKAVAQAELARLKAEPREEELPPLRAAVQRAKVVVADSKDMVEEMESARKQGAGSQTELNRRRYAIDVALANLAVAEANLALAEKGAWAPVVAAAEARVAAAEAELGAIAIRMQRLVIVSPIDGVVLKRGIEPGEFAAAAGAGGMTMSSGGGAAFAIGDIDTLRVRARVDEEDLSQLREGAKGMARIRGVNPEDVALTMVRIEPLAEAKMSLMGTTTERVDTRVVEVLFEVQGTTKVRLFPGQAVDVFIDAGTP